jgi:hypothetical protein
MEIALTRKSKSLVSSPKVVFLVGNGAVRNGDGPLDSFLKSNNSFLRFSTTKERDLYYKEGRSASVLSCAAFIYRAFTTNVLDPRSPPLTVNTPNVRGLKDFKRSRISLARSFKAAKIKNEIGIKPLRPDLNKIIYDESTGVITTNWDELLWDDKGIKNLIQIHGRCSIPSSLILPMELTVDELAYGRLRKLAKYLLTLNGGSPPTAVIAKDLNERVTFCARPKKIRTELRDTHQLAISWLENAEHLIVWGTALHPYDAEWASLIGISQHDGIPAKKRVTIINPSKTDRDKIAAHLRVTYPVRQDVDPRSNLR